MTPPIEEPAGQAKPQPVTGDLRVSVADTVDPLAVNGQTTYIISIENGRIVSDRQVAMTILLPPGLEYLSLRGPVVARSLSDDKVRSIYRDNSGLLWVGTYSGGVNLYNPKGKKFSHYRHLPGNPDPSSPDQVYCIYEEPSGVLWMGTGARGLHRWDPGSDTFTRYRRRKGDRSSLSGDNVLAVFEDHAGRFWIGVR